MKLFLKDYKGYIFIYYIGIVMTIIYCNLMKFISFERVYIFFYLVLLYCYVF